MRKTEPSITATIQSIGQQAHAAIQLIEQIKKARTSALIVSLDAAPGNDDDEGTYAQIRQLNRLTHKLREVDQCLKDAYAMSQTIESPAAVKSRGRGIKSARVAAPLPAATKRRGSRTLGSKNEETLLGYLRGHLDASGVTPPLNFRNLAAGTGIPHGTISATMKRLKDKGLLTIMGQNRYILKT